MTDFIFLDSEITADSDCSHEIKRHLFFGRKNLDSGLRGGDITLLTKVLVKAMVFPGVMYGCESWSVKKVEHQTTDAFNWSGAGKDSRESLGLQGGQTSQS